MYHVFHWLPKKRITAPIFKPTYDQKPETFLGGPCMASAKILCLPFEQEIVIVSVEFYV